MRLLRVYGTPIALVVVGLLIFRYAPVLGVIGQILAALTWAWQSKKEAEYRQRAKR